jgi:hypothetical protein
MPSKAPSFALHGPRQLHAAAAEQSSSKLKCSMRFMSQLTAQLELTTDYFNYMASSPNPTLLSSAGATLSSTATPHHIQNIA